jgi:hypothetical protein
MGGKMTNEEIEIMLKELIKLLADEDREQLRDNLGWRYLDKICCKDEYERDNVDSHNRMIGRLQNLALTGEYKYA